MFGGNQYYNPSLYFMLSLDCHIVWSSHISLTTYLVDHYSCFKYCSIRAQILDLSLWYNHARWYDQFPFHVKTQTETKLWSSAWHLIFSFMSGKPFVVNLVACWCWPPYTLRFEKVFTIIMNKKIVWYCFYIAMKRPLILESYK